MTHGTFGWNELMTSNIDATKAFYAKVAGWTYQDVPLPDGTSYTLASVDGREMPVAGLMQWPADKPGANDWFAYINVDDIDSAVETTVAAGGQIMRAPFLIENTGRIAIVTDSVGVAIGYLEPLPM